MNDVDQKLRLILKSALEQSIGEPASQENLKRLTRRVLIYLRREGYLQATVRNRGYERVGDETRALLTLSPRSPIQFHFEGNTVFDREELLQPLKLETRTVPFSFSAVENLRRGILELYQSRGYFFASVQSSSTTAVGNDGIERQIFTLTIDEGGVWKIRDVLFDGGLREYEATLRSEMTTFRRQGWRGLFARDPFLVNDELASDLVRIQEKLRTLGYPSAEARFKLLFDESERSIVVSISVDPGEKRLVSSAEYRYDGTEPSPDLRTQIEQSDLPGAPAEQSGYDGEVARITEVLFSAGYADASVKYDPSSELLKPRFLISPGERIRLGKIRVHGNIYTQNDVVRREIPLRPGDLLDPSKVQLGKRKLYRTGIYRNVTADILPSENPLEKDIQVTVEERDTGKIGLGVAFNTEDGLRFTTELGQQNLGGEGRSVTAAADLFLRTGSQLLDAGRARAEYRQPHFLGSENIFINELFFQHDVEIVRAYSFDRYGLSPYIRREFDEHSLFDLGYTVFGERLYDVEPDAIASSDDTGSRIYSLIRSQVQLDYRDDPYNPRRGFFASLEGRFGSDATLSDVNMGVVNGQLAAYFSLTSDLVWASSVRGSLARTFGDSEAVPITQRFFLGGRNSLRGFSRNQIGPRGTDLTIAGGDTALIFNNELQLDISENVVSVLFADVGQSYLVEPGEFKGDPQSFDTLRVSPGLGLRYRTPIGPLSVEYGFALGREFGERPGRLIVGIGSTF